MSLLDIDLQLRWCTEGRKDSYIKTNLHTLKKLRVNSFHFPIFSSIFLHCIDYQSRHTCSVRNRMFDWFTSLKPTSDQTDPVGNILKLPWRLMGTITGNIQSFPCYKWSWSVRAQLELMINTYAENQTAVPFFVTSERFQSCIAFLLIPLTFSYSAGKKILKKNNKKNN